MRRQICQDQQRAGEIRFGFTVSRLTRRRGAARDTATLPATLTMAAEQVEAVQPAGKGVEEVVADKGYDSDETLEALEEVGVRSYLPEPNRGRRRWRDKKTGELSAEKAAAQRALYGNRRCARGDRGGLQRRRGELVERPFAHQYATGGLRRVWVRGHEQVRKRVLIQVAGFNLGLLLRNLFGVGTPRSLRGRALPALFGLIGPLNDLWRRLGGHGPRWGSSAQSFPAKLPEQTGAVRAANRLSRAAREPVRRAEPRGDGWRCRRAI